MVSIEKRIAKTLGLACASALPLIAISDPAFAVPSFARQTGQPCETCHVGAFGPQLTQFGREFKLNGYVWNDGGDHNHLAGMLMASLTHTNADQPGGAAPGFGPNNDLAIDQISLFYGGKITDNAGAFIQVTYDGIAKQLTWDNADIRYARTVQLDGKPLILGATLNNNPTVQDPWNSTPGSGFSVCRLRSRAVACGCHAGRWRSCTGGRGRRRLRIVGRSALRRSRYLSGPRPRCAQCAGRRAGERLGLLR